MYVEPLSTYGAICCSKCPWWRMVAVSYHDLERDAWWLFWRCTRNPNHVTCALPTPRGYVLSDAEATL